MREGNVCLSTEKYYITGHCCYSCRAFFRRTSQRVKLKGLKKCKTGLGLCDVSEAAKSCINCRYSKCLSIGMTPDLLQGKRKREEEEVEPKEEEEEENLEEKVFSEPTGEENEEPDPEAETEAKHLIFNEEIAEQPEQEKPLKLVKKANTQLSLESGIIKINIEKLTIPCNQVVTHRPLPPLPSPITDHQLSDTAVRLTTFVRNRISPTPF